MDVHTSLCGGAVSPDAIMPGRRPAVSFASVVFFPSSKDYTML
jgi:hypothetical protein